MGVQVPGEKFRAQASFLSGEARTRVFDEVKRRAPFFGDYEKSSGTREIPVVELARV